MCNLAKMQELEASATLFETPCGPGVMVWRAWGPPDGCAVVLLHGGSGSWTHWVRNITALVRSGRRVIVPDLPGFGDSAAPPDGEDADVLPAWLELGLQSLIGAAPVDLAGFSFGGLVAGLWAHAVPQRVARLVLIGCPGFSREEFQPLDIRRWNTVPTGPARDAAHRHNLLQLMLAQDAAADAFAVGLHAMNVVRDRMLRRRLMLTDVLVPILPTLTCPVSGIWGALDGVYRDRLDLIGRVLALAPGFESLVLVPGAGHWVQFEAATEFNAVMTSALRSA